MPPDSRMPYVVPRRPFAVSLVRWEVRVAVDKLPVSVDLSEDLGDAETHCHWARRVANPYRGNLEACPKPEGAVAALLNYLELCCSIRMKARGFLDIACRNIFCPDYSFSARTMKASHPVVWNKTIQLGAVTANVSLCGPLAN
jgi:hypothetical protein